jgi:16S rRNA (adenine1518-N6/adenine1519-N6)-dimethyltransferase
LLLLNVKMPPRKRFGQHWLQSDKILDQIVAAAELKSDDIVLEIGPGKGALTRRLLDFVKVLAVEIDRDLCPFLVKKFGNNDNFVLLQGDILSLDINPLIAGLPRFQYPNKVVANIPYNITGPILEKLLGTISRPSETKYDSIVLLIQKEVGDRLTAKPESRDFGALSVRVQYLADCELICDVPAKCFFPPPKVDSVVVRLTPRDIATPANDPKLLETLVKVGFSSKRKMLKNNLKSLISVEKLEELLTELHIKHEARGEELSLTDWVNLSNIFPKD